MPPVGLEPATSTYADQTITQHTKWADEATTPVFTVLKPVLLI